MLSVFLVNKDVYITEVNDILRAKFTIDSISNFFVREVGRGSGVLERSLEIAEVLRGEEGDDEDRKPVCTHFGKRYGKFSVEKSF